MTLKFKAFYFLLLSTVFVIPLSQQLSGGLILITSVFSFFIDDFERIISSFLRNAWDSLFYLGVLIFGLFFSDDLHTGLKVIESNLSFLAIPIIFGRLEILPKEYLIKVFYAFAGGLCLACIICLVHAGIVFNQTGDFHSFFFYSLTDVLGFQPTYYAYYLIFVISFAFYQLYYRLDKTKTWVYIVLITFLFLILILTGGQTAYISMLMIFSFFILRFIIEERTVEKKITLAMVLPMIVCMFVSVSILKGESGWNFNDAWNRLVVWEAGIESIPNLLVGVGTGDYKAVLHDYYVLHNLEKFAVEYFNSHNQFIQILYSNGLLGVAALILMIARPLYISVINHHVLGILLFFPFLIYGMTEVFFGRYQGIIFFAFIHQFIVVQINSQNPIILAKDNLSNSQ